MSASTISRTLLKHKGTELGRHINTVLFDLDGTLLDTAADLTTALNTLLQEHQRPTLSLDTVRPVVSNGGRAMLRLGFALPEGHPYIESLLSRFLQLYADKIAVHTKLFEGMGALLAELERQHITWGVVTNKQACLTEPLLVHMALHLRAACVVSGDTTPYRKPHPAPLLHACKQIGRQSQQCVYVGDHPRDIEAGRQAGMRTVVALFGYIPQHDNPQQWQADAMIEHPLALLDWLRRHG